MSQELTRSLVRHDTLGKIPQVGEHADLGVDEDSDVELEDSAEKQKAREQAILQRLQQLKTTLDDALVAHWSTMKHISEAEVDF
jgi:hypothetical protein